MTQNILSPHGTTLSLCFRSCEVAAETVGGFSFGTPTVTKCAAREWHMAVRDAIEILAAQQNSQGWIRTTIGGSKDRPPAGRFKMPTLADSSTLSGSGCFWAFDCYKIRDRAHA
jgi:hypothetical protein